MTQQVKANFDPKTLSLLKRVLSKLSKAYLLTQEHRKSGCALPRVFSEQHVKVSGTLDDYALPDCAE